MLPERPLLLKRESFNSIFKISHLTPAILGNVINQSKTPALCGCESVEAWGKGCVNSLAIPVSWSPTL